MGLFIVEFDLNTKPPLTVENGDVIVDRGIPTITVRNVEADSVDDAEKKARHKANACNQCKSAFSMADESG